MYSQKPTGHDYENMPYYKDEPSRQRQNQIQEDINSPRLQNQRLSQRPHRLVQERTGEWHSDLEAYANMEPISWNNMARFAQKPHGSYYPENPPMPYMSAAQQHQKQKYRIETHSKILPYVVRDHSWNFDSHDGTNFGKYKSDAPQAYAADVDYELPHPTNIPTEADPLLPCTPAEEIEWAAEKSAAAAAGLPKPDAWCESSVADPDPVEDDQAATDEATAAENTGAEAAANGTVVAPPASGATAHKKTKANVPKSLKGGAHPKSKSSKSIDKEFEDKKAKKEAAAKKSAETNKSAEASAKAIVTSPIKEKEVTDAIDNDQKSHAAIKTKDDHEHLTDPNDIVHEEAPKPAPKKVEILKDPTVEAKKSNKPAKTAKKDSDANKTNNPPVLKLKADS